ncbi:MAG: histidine kinase [Lawsonibacter sp.]|nr:histidine kinase [Lawsonibacter sp.]
MRKEKTKIFPIIILIAIVSAMLIYLVTKTGFSKSLAQNGTLDLSQWDGESVLYLSGDWDFYWNRFLNKLDLEQNQTPDLKAAVPSVWNNFAVDGNSLGGMGYATYRLHITGAKIGAPLAMRLIPFSTAYELYVDDERVASSGKISTSANGFEPQYRVQTVTFTPDHDEFDIIIHIANFVYARGGAWYAVYLGSPEKINTLSQLVFGRDFFIMGSLLIISAYCLFLFFHRRETGYLLFLILCLIIFGRTVINGNYLINVFFPAVKFRTVILIDYFTLYWLPGFCLWLFYYISPTNISRRLVRLLFIYSAGITALTLAVPMRIFTNFIYIAEWVAAIIGVYGVIKMVELVLRHEPEAMFLFAGGSALTFCIFHDVLCENDMISTGYVEYSPMGFLILAIFLQCLFGIRYDRQREENETMLRTLNEADQREQKLELQFLKSQIRPHFINNALNAIISIARTDSEKSRTLLIEFSKYLHSCYGVQNLDDKVPIENELSFVRAYVTLEQARFSDSLHVDYEIDSMFLMLPPLSLQPLVENAVNHGVREKSEDGHILIYVKDCGDFVRVGVSDDGVGIDPELAAAVLSNEHQGTGVGIYNINIRMKRLYHTELHLDRRPEGGTDAYIIIPKVGEPC